MHLYLGYWNKFSKERKGLLYFSFFERADVGRFWSPYWQCKQHIACLCWFFGHMGNGSLASLKDWTCHPPKGIVGTWSLQLLTLQEVLHFSLNCIYKKIHFFSGVNGWVLDKSTVWGTTLIKMKQLFIQFPSYFCIPRLIPTTRIFSFSSLFSKAV